MVVLPQEIEICIYHKNYILDEYRTKGYECELGVPFMVKFEDLRAKQNVKIKVKCDYCGKEFMMKNGHYQKDVLGGIIKKVACIDCSRKKQAESNMLVYGVKSTAQLKEVREKQKNTMLERYGVVNILQTEDGQRKAKETNMKKYGVEWAGQAECVRNKRENTMLERYGYRTPSEVPEINAARKETFRKKYGVENPFMVDDVKNKIYETFGSRGKVRTSKAQQDLNDVVNGKLNQKIGKYNVDIVTDDNVVIEYDGGGHDICVQLGNITQEEFDKKEKCREDAIIESGYKIIRFINAHDRELYDKEKVRCAIKNCKAELDAGKNIVRYDFATNVIQ